MENNKQIETTMPQLNSRLDVISCSSMETIQNGITRVLAGYQDLMPADRDALIVLKPNLNSHMNALTGNTTDLRLLRAVIVCLKQQGYTRILIGDGTNSGFYRNKINVMTRLQIHRLADLLGVGVRDFNETEPSWIQIGNHAPVAVAREVFEADLLINMPKIKTHAETGMSVCLKNLIGCLIGQTHKKRMHENLPENILILNQRIKPHLHIVDGLISMQGLGPTRGTPLKTDMILVGTDPILIDLACAKLAGLDYRRIKPLALAEKKGWMTPAHREKIDSLELDPERPFFDPPKPGLPARFIHDPRRQNFFLKIRNTRFFAFLASTDWFGRCLVKTGLRQDVFDSREMVCESLTVHPNLCINCGACRAVCPSALDLPKDLNKGDRCIQCLYCYCVCPVKAIEFQGDLGYFKEQLTQYDPLIRQLYRNNTSGLTGIPVC